MVICVNGIKYRNASFNCKRFIIDINYTYLDKQACSGHLFAWQNSSPQIATKNLDDERTLSQMIMTQIGDNEDP